MNPHAHLALTALLAAGMLGRPAAAAEPPTTRATLCPGEWGCFEQCPLADATPEAPSPLFLAKLRSIASTKHHVDTDFGPALVARLPWFRVANVYGMTRDAAARWQVNRRFAGPCAGLVAVFTSVAVEDDDDRNVVDLYELRYADEAAARRVQSLLTFPVTGTWDWNYHPFAAAQAERSVFVIEGRWRAKPAFKRVAAHFGASLVGGRPPPALPPCGPNPPGKALLAIDAEDSKRALSVFALGFSASGRLAWLEQRAGADARGVEWTVQLIDLINDRALPGKVLRVGGDVAAMCRTHAAEVSSLLADSDIQPVGDLALEQPAPGQDPTGVELRPGPKTGSIDVVLRAAAGEKKIGALTQVGGAAAPSLLGFLRSPFEPRVAIAVSQASANARRGPTIHFFGGRLDKRWKPPAPPPPDPQRPGKRRTPPSSPAI